MKNVKTTDGASVGTGPFFSLLFSIFYWAILTLWSVSLYLFENIFWLLTFPFDRNARWLNLITCFWGTWAFKFNPYWRLRLLGKENLPKGQSYIIVANHQSNFDIFSLCALRVPFRFLAKRSLFLVPILGWGMRLNGHIMVHRDKNESRAMAFEKCRYWLRRGVPVVIFPEGTRSESGTIHDFRPGAFRLAIEENVPLVPIVIEGTKEIQRKSSLLINGKRNITLKILKPIQARYAMGELPAFIESVRTEMISELEAVRRTQGQ